MVLGIINNKRERFPLDDNLFEMHNSAVASRIMARFDAIPGDGRGEEKKGSTPQTPKQGQKSEDDEMGVTPFKWSTSRANGKAATRWRHQRRPLPTRGRAPQTQRRENWRAYRARPEEAAPQSTTSSDTREPMRNLPRRNRRPTRKEGGNSAARQEHGGGRHGGLAKMEAETAAHKQGIISAYDRTTEVQKDYRTQLRRNDIVETALQQFEQILETATPEARQAKTNGEGAGDPRQHAGENAEPSGPTVGGNEGRTFLRYGNHGQGSQRDGIKNRS